MKLKQVEWPLCHVHNRLLLVGTADSVWLCSDDGHEVARIGELGEV